MKVLIAFILFSFTLFASAAEYKVDEVRVYKLKHRMEMLFEGKITKVYNVMLGRGGMAPKRQEGDKRVPEGEYILDLKNPYSKFYRSIHISYPNEDDIKRAEDMGVNPGNEIFIHGQPKIFKPSGDWTAGCIAVTNNEMAEIWHNIEVPVKITIFH